LVNASKSLRYRRHFSKLNGLSQKGSPFLSLKSIETLFSKASRNKKTGCVGIQAVLDIELPIRVRESHLRRKEK
jgi:hypothetical protein